MTMPNKLILYLGQFNVLPIQFSNDLRGPMFVEFSKLVEDVNGFHNCLF